MFPRSRARVWDPCVYDFEGRAVRRRELGRTRGAGDTAKQGCGLRWRQPQLKTTGVLEHALHTELGPLGEGLVFGTLPCPHQSLTVGCTFEGGGGCVTSWVGVLVNRG